MAVAQEVGPRIWRVGGPIANFYLLEERGRLTVIDAGVRRDWRRLRAALGEIGLAPRTIEAVVLTHAHIDHVGFADRARRDLGTVIYLHQRDLPTAQLGAGSIRTRVAQRTALDLGARLAVRLLIAGAVPYPAIREASTFGDGEVLDVPGRPAVVHTPGHTAGSSVLLCRERGAAFTGDALVVEAVGGDARASLPRRHNRDTAEALRSLDRLESYEVGLVLPGHGPPYRGGLAAAPAEAREGFAG